MIDIENEYSELSLFLKDHNVLVPDTKNKDLDVYEMIQLILEKNNPTTAFYIINLGEIIRQLKLWRELFPYIAPKYAVKCNPNPVICQLLGLLGVGFDVASGFSLRLDRWFRPVLQIGRSLEPHSVTLYLPFSPE